MNRLSKRLEEIRKDPSILFNREPEPELYFTDIGIGKDKVYKIKIFDVCNPEMVTINKSKGHYWVYKCELIEGFDNQQYLHYLHFPTVSFIHAWNTGPNHRKMTLGETYDCWLSFFRENKRRLVIVERKYSEVRMNG